MRSIPRAKGDVSLPLPPNRGGAFPAGITIVSGPPVPVVDGITCKGGEGGRVVLTPATAGGTGETGRPVGRGVTTGLEKGAAKSGTGGRSGMGRAWSVVFMASGDFGKFVRYFVGSSLTQPCEMAQRKKILSVERRLLIVAMGTCASTCERL